MPNDTVALRKKREMDQWLVSLDPGLRNVFDAAFDSDEETKQKVSPDQRAALDADEDALVQRAKQMAQAKQQPASTTAAPAGGASVKVGAEVDLGTKKFKHATKYGDLEISVTVKTSASVSAGDDGGIGFSGTVTSTEKSDGRATGTKKNISYKDIDDRQLFDGLDLTGLSIGGEFKIDGLDVSVAAKCEFTVTAKAFKAPGSLTGIILKIKDGKDIQTPGVEVKIAPTAFKLKIGGVETAVKAEFKASFIVDVKKVGAEIGEAALKKLAKEEVKKAAEKQGVKMLGREATEAVLRDLGPLAAAFSVGWDIGSLLNEFTVAPQVAGFAMDEILGDLNERYQNSSTLGKMWLLSKNSPRIVGALVVAGVTGAAAGIGDVVLFKIMGLPTAADFKEAFNKFMSGITDVMEGVKEVGEKVQEMGTQPLLYNAFMLGIKTNPKHAICAHASLEPIVAAIFATLKPLYGPDGLNKIINVHVKDCRVDEAALQKFASFAQGAKMQYDGKVDLSSGPAVANSLKEMLIVQFLGFLEANKMIRYNVETKGDMNPDKIDQKLLDELFG